MSNKIEIKPHKVTKPLQLLAAWLAGLVAVDTLFLYTASSITEPEWAAAALVIAAILYVPLFLGAIFLLQTKFRPEMQEDPFYHEYLRSITGNTPIEPAPDALVEWASEPGEDAAVVDSGTGIDSVEAEKPANRIAENTASYIIETETVWGSSRVAVNKSRLDFIEILGVLKENGIPFTETFGGIIGDVPAHFQISVGHKVEFSEIELTVIAFAKFHAGHIGTINPLEASEDLSDTVLIGSYGQPSGPKLTEAAEILENDLMSETDFFNFLRSGTY